MTFDEEVEYYSLVRTGTGTYRELTTAEKIRLNHLSKLHTKMNAPLYEWDFKLLKKMRDDKD